MSTLATVVRLSALATALAAAVAVAPPAHAAANPYTPERVCGSGYRVIDRQGVNGGIVYLLWNGSSNCVTTIKTAAVGTPSATTARLEVRGSSTVTADRGNYRYFAGPVRRAAAHRCVRWGGSTYLAGYLSPFEHCS